MKRVAVIGGGAAGISTARNLLATNSLSVVLFESSPSLGGTWEITSNASSMYNNLKTNLPARVMEFPDYPFHFKGEEKSSFPGWQEVRDYLREYADWGGVKGKEVVKLEEVVTDVRYDEKETKWVVSSTSPSSSSSSEQFDSVVVCNGHYTTPKIPDIPGLDAFSAHENKHVMHSHTYKSPDEFHNKKIVVLGGGASGVDISLDLAIHCPSSEIILSHRLCPSSSSSSSCSSSSSSTSSCSSSCSSLPLSSPSPPEDVSGIDGGARGLALYQNRTPNLTQLPPIAHIDQKTLNVAFEDGTEVAGVDVIMFCTGYHYSYPFLSSLFKEEGEGKKGEDKELLVKNRVISPLFKQMFYIPRPTLAFIGLPWRVCPFPLFHYQASYLASVLTSQSPLSLPSREKMEEDMKREKEGIKNEGLPEKYGHMLGEKQWKYFDELIELREKVEEKGEGEVEKKERERGGVRNKMYDHCSYKRRADPLTYRKTVYTEKDGEIEAREGS